MESALTPALLDTNILVYANNLDAPLHEPCRKLVEDALSGRFQAFLAHQNLLELYAVVTDKRRVEHPLSPQSANELIGFYLSASNLSVIFPTTVTFTLLSELISSHAPISHGIFDLMLVALMKEHGLSVIHTANVRHYSDFQGISAICPA
jgi:predicted nucleic acid-binding protein